MTRTLAKRKGRHSRRLREEMAKVDAGLLPDGVYGFDVHFIRFMLKSCQLEMRALKKTGAPPDLYNAYLRQLNEDIKDTGFTVHFDEKFLE